MWILFIWTIFVSVQTFLHQSVLANLAQNECTFSKKDIIWIQRRNQYLHRLHTHILFSSDKLSQYILTDFEIITKQFWWKI